MAMALNSALYIAKMAWIALSGWITSCLTIADEFATSLRSGDIGPFHVGPPHHKAIIAKQVYSYPDIDFKRMKSYKLI
ncbi:hypothetical protein MTR_7g090260 [Medicago truncatula]|uniref:Transmembrane protein n=2 Tax=Medicago truncatula TaxID=3880 RepID=G7KRN5_MEDTR|nr:hypothetical protein MTR_7g090260 [Medicago truncatula]